ncbi:MAG: AAC(3) family N-acetyltransferase [Methanobacterium sp.]
MLKSQKQLNECSKDELTGQLIALGVKKGDILLVHTSFRAIKPIEDGPKGLIESIPKSPVGRVYDMNGKVLLLGVGHDANTMIHLAELLADVPCGVPKYCTVSLEERSVRIKYEENDHCCQCFVFMDNWLRVKGLQSEGYVGHAHARLARARDVVRIALEHLNQDPLLFLHHPSLNCDECNEARNSIEKK